MRCTSPTQTRLIATLVVLSIGLCACNSAAAATEDFEALWEQSAHADAESRSFTRWDDADPPEIPTNCAKCHSTHGYLDYLGADGSVPGEVNHPSPVGSTIECDACHNEAAEAKDSAGMPSQLVISGLGQESNCLACHQGRASARHVAEALDGLPRGEVDADLSMPRLHSNPAGATYYGSEAKGGGEYRDHEYLGEFYHGFDDCTTCHDSHTLDVRVDKCSACHLGATTLEGVRDIRLGRTDYDGDGDTTEGIAGEIETMQEHLLRTIQVYAVAVDAPGRIDYDGGWIDDDGEAYATWTPELLQAAYNYDYALEDPGSYSHNPKYVMQLLYDGIDDLGGSTLGMTRP